jgi:HD superfamily phosphodiesterase
MIRYEDVRRNDAIKEYIKAADRSLQALGYTEHSFAHVGKVAEDAANILLALDYPERDVELARIAGYMHDIGNLVNREEHSQSGAVMAFRLLDNMGMPANEIAEIVTAIGNHDEGTGVPVSPLAAALILADKSDVRRTRVRNSDPMGFDIHDRVNYSVLLSELKIDKEERTASLNIKIDTAISAVMNYFEIFLGRMILCRGAAEKLGLSFRLIINDQQLF